jgi:glycosyltransferase involved in cell wall biosynthesis
VKPRILIFTDFYLPGYKSGGGLRTLVNMVERLSDEFEFQVVARNHDGWGDFTPYPNIHTNQWNTLGKTQVYYFGKEGLGSLKLKKIWQEALPDVIYLNSFFSTLTIKSMLLRSLGQVPKTPIVIAPEGEFSPGALQIKARKKNIFLTFVKRLNWRRGVFWKAAANEEKSDIQRVLGNKCEIYVAPNMPPKTILADYSPALKPIKRAGELSLVFLSRLNRKKNLSFVLELLKKTKGEVHIDVFGACDDEPYWEECQNLLHQMPSNIKVKICGSVEYEKVALVMSGYHFFILPTHGENFGHVILEAFAAGCPVLLSNKTPWRELEAKKIGWDISLDNADKWHKVLQQCVEMPASEFAECSKAAREFADEWLAAPEVEAANRDVLRGAFSSAKINLDI